MYIYLFILILCILLLGMQMLIVKKYKKFFIGILLSILAFLSGTRYNLGGSDYEVYKTSYETIPSIKNFFLNFLNLDSIYITFGFEKGYLLITSIAKTLGLNFFGFTLIHSLFFYLCLYKFVKKNTLSYFLVIGIFIYKLLFYNTFISMRQSITIAIFLLAIEFIKRKSPIKYFTLIAISSTIHVGAIILFPVYFINKVKFTRKKLVFLNAIFIPTLLVYFFNIPIGVFLGNLISLMPNNVITGKVSNYLINGTNVGLSMLHILEYFLIMIIVIIYFNKIKLVEYYNIYLGLFICLLPIFTILSNYEIITRFKDYFIISYALLLGILLYPNNKYNILIKMGIFFICLLGTIRYILMFDDGHLMQYESYLLKSISIFE